MHQGGMLGNMVRNKTKKIGAIGYTRGCTHCVAVASLAHNLAWFVAGPFSWSRPPSPGCRLLIMW